ncbi:Xenobiotic-transporting ATPase [Legionella fallonii LLAP-10]|uniref:Xenobiotic-transporting ATPase n=1 Tax=Legionella fallonii LLAP-10 TaxID=1212491 RepID=A0A098G2P5_9GAMM|nr:Xenobiotic-transporting ATPase [Legionella fallonii LLAP-10]
MAKETDSLSIRAEEQVISLKKLLYSFWLENKFLCCCMMLLFLLTALISMFRPVIAGSVFHGYQIKQVRLITDSVYALLVCNGFIIILSAVRALIYMRCEIKVLLQLQKAAMKKVLQLPLDFFDRYTTGDLVHRVLWVTSLSQLLQVNQLGVVFSFLSLLVSFSLMFYFNWQLTLVVFLLVALFTLFAVLSSLRLLPYLEEHATDVGRAYGFLYQVINGITRIKLFSRQSNVASLWNAMYVSSRHRLQSTYSKGVLGYAFFNSIPLLLLLIVFAVSLLQRESISSPYFVVFFCGLCLLMTNIVTFYLNAGGLIDALIAYRRIQPILDFPIETTSTNSIGTDEFIEHISMRDLYFSYPNSKISVLKGVNCQISQGQHVAFVGLSGSGKSTLIKLLLGFYFPQQGQVAINGKPLQELDLPRLRSNIGVALQDGQLMNGSILENIIGHSAATEEEAWQMLAELGMHQFIHALPMGIHTVVAQHMNLLSGGQKQMLLIARALVGKPQLLILDEATNSLDEVVQEMVIKRINQLAITRITIAHRLSTVKDVDKIFVLHQGVIAEAGSYQQLLKQEGFFAQLATS